MTTLFPSSRARRPIWISRPSMTSDAASGFPPPYKAFIHSSLVGRPSEAHRRLLVDVVATVPSTDRDHVACIGPARVPAGDLTERQAMVGFPGAVADLGHDDVPAVTETPVRTEHMVTVRRSGL